MKMNENLVKVSAQSDPNKVAGMIAGVLDSEEIIELQAIGAGAINQSVKAIAIARGFVAPSGYNLVCTPGFSKVNVAGEERTGMRFLVKKIK